MVVWMDARASTNRTTAFSTAANVAAYIESYSVTCLLQRVYLRKPFSGIPISSIDISPEAMPGPDESMFITWHSQDIFYVSIADYVMEYRITVHWRASPDIGNLYLFRGTR